MAITLDEAIQHAQANTNAKARRKEDDKKGRPVYNGPSQAEQQIRQQIHAHLVDCCSLMPADFLNAQFDSIPWHEVAVCLEQCNLDRKISSTSRTKQRVKV